MRILVVIYEFPPIGGGGGMAARNICQALQARGHEVHVITAHYRGLPRQETLDGVQVIRVRSLRASPYQARLMAMTGFILAGGWAGWRHIHDWRPDVIHVHFAVPSGPVAWALSRLTGIPYVLTAHLGDVPNGVPEKTRQWFRWVYPLTPPLWRSAAAVAAVSEFTRGLALASYSRRITVIPNGVDLRKLDPGEICIHRPPVIVFAGRLMPQKNPLQLVRTLAQLKHLDWRCRLMGDGPLRAEIERAIELAGLQDRFELTGWIPPEEVIAHFGQADILFMPSLSEGLPVVGVQALAMGLAIVAARIGGFIDLVEDGVNGYLVSPDEPQGYAEALEEALGSSERLLAFRRASRAKAGEFDIRHVAEQYERLFQEVVAGEQARRSGRKA